MTEKPMILIIYSSYSGNTEELAKTIAEGSASAGNVEVSIKRACDINLPDISGSSAIAFGSPTYFSYMSGELKSLFDRSLPYRHFFEDKPAMAFATGEGGQLTCIESIERILEFFGSKFVQKSTIISAGLAVQGKPDKVSKKYALEAGKRLGEAGIEFSLKKIGRQSGIAIR
jgi:NAD(P)H dehydrogenase (quinone)